MDVKALLKQAFSINNLAMELNPNPLSIKYLKDRRFWIRRQQRSGSAIFTPDSTVCSACGFIAHTYAPHISPYCFHCFNTFNRMRCHDGVCVFVVDGYLFETSTQFRDRSVLIQPSGRELLVGRMGPILAPAAFCEDTPGFRMKYPGTKKSTPLVNPNISSY